MGALQRDYAGGHEGDRLGMEYAVGKMEWGRGKEGSCDKTHGHKGREADGFCGSSVWE